MLLELASRSFGGRVQSNEEAIASLSGTGGSGDQDEAIQCDPYENHVSITMEKDFGDDSMRMRQARSCYDGNRLMIHGDDKVHGPY